MKAKKMSYFVPQSNNILFKEKQMNAKKLLLLLITLLLIISVTACGAPAASAEEAAPAEAEAETDTEEEAAPAESEAETSTEVEELSQVIVGLDPDYSTFDPARTYESHSPIVLNALYL